MKSFRASPLINVSRSHEEDEDKVYMIRKYIKLYNIEIFITYAINWSTCSLSQPSSRLVRRCSRLFIICNHRSVNYSNRLEQSSNYFEYSLVSVYRVTQKEWSSRILYRCTSLPNEPICLRRSQYHLDNVGSPRLRNGYTRLLRFVNARKLLEQPPRMSLPYLSC